MPERGLREQKKERTRLRLIDEAFALFEKQGYDATTVEEIAAAADVTSRTFFRYFTSKEDLVMLGQDEENQQIAQLLKSRPPRESNFDFMLRAVRTVPDRSAEMLKRSRRARQLLRSTPALRYRERGILAEVEEKLAKGLTPARASKAEALQIRIEVAVFLAMTNVVMNAHLDGELRGDPIEHLERAVHALRRGFR
jgi:AcrR family transcriptional regulator